MSSASIPMHLLRLQVYGTELTSTEKHVLKLYAHGYTQKQVGEKRHSSYETVRKQTRMIRARLGAKTTAEAVAIAISLDII